MNCNRHPVVRIKKIVNGGYGLARLEDGKTVYGITTGFGNFSDVVISKEESKKLQ